MEIDHRGAPWMEMDEQMDRCTVEMVWVGEIEVQLTQQNTIQYNGNVNRIPSDKIVGFGLDGTAISRSLAASENESLRERIRVTRKGDRFRTHDCCPCI